MKEKFEDRKLSGKIRIKLNRDDHSCGKYWECEKTVLVNHMKNIVVNYANQGYRLTLRQLYYQLVAKDFLPNDDACYSKLSSVLDDCRYSGVIDWDCIEDRGRVPFTPYFEISVEDAIRRTKDSYSLDRRTAQPNYVELWTEKDAISGILKKSVYEYTITVGVNKGFASSTSIHNAYLRFAHKIFEEKKKVIVLYFGDHDPSGLDMIRDIRERIEMMLLNGRKKYDLLQIVRKLDSDDMYDILLKWGGEDEFLTEYRKHQEGADNLDIVQNIMCKYYVKELFTIEHIGLTKEQIEEHNLPPNPAKISDPRAKGYIKEHGEISWEVDALQPTDLEKIVKSKLVQFVDMKKYQEVLDKEEDDKRRLESIIDGKESGKPEFNDPEEWGEWVCPKCYEENSDPENVRRTICSSCESSVILSDAVERKRKAKLA